MSEPANKKEKTLHWEEEDVIWHGHVELSINGAKGNKGYQLWSLLFGRLGKNGERESNFIRPEDIDDAIEALRQAKVLFANGGPQQ